MVYAKNGYSATNRSQVLTFTSWASLEDITGESLSQKVICCRVTFIGNNRKDLTSQGRVGWRSWKDMGAVNNMGFLLDEMF